MRKFSKTNGGIESQAKQRGSCHLREGGTTFDLFIAYVETVIILASYTVVNAVPLIVIGATGTSVVADNSLFTSCRSTKNSSPNEENTSILS